MKRRLLAMCGIVALAALACGVGGPDPTPVPTPTLVPLPPGAVVLETDIENFSHYLPLTTAEAVASGWEDPILCSPGRGRYFWKGTPCSWQKWHSVEFWDG